MTSTPQHSGVDISPVAGPLILGYFFMFGLFGVLNSQVYIYNVSFPTDKIITKIMVYGIYILATLQVTLTFYDAIISLAFGFGNLAALSKGNMSFLAAPLLTGTIALIVQTFYAYRIHVLTKSRILPAIVICLAIMQCASGFVSGIFEVFIGDLSKITQFRRETLTEGGWVISSGLCDIIIATSMWLQVYKFSKEGISRTTQSMLARIVKLIVGTGAMTATVAVIAAVLFAALPHSVAYTAPCSVLAQLYANSMLVVLNNRLRFTNQERFDTSNAENFQLEARSFEAFECRKPKSLSEIGSSSGQTGNQLSSVSTSL